MSESKLITEWLTKLQHWFNTSLSSTSTLIELAVIFAAAAIAWPLSVYLRREIEEFGQGHARSALLRRLWLKLGQVSFPIVWLVIQLCFDFAMEQMGFHNGTIVVTSSLLTAWIVISIATVFVVNPLGSKFIALFVWLVAALNITGYLDEMIALLESTSFSLGQVDVTAFTITKGIITLALLLWITALVGQMIEGRIKASPNMTPSIQVLTSKLLRIVLAIMAFVFALTIVGIDLTVFAVFGGAIGVGLGFGLQKIFANLVSGFILLLDKSIKPGDVIAVSDNYGRVDSLGARYVSVLTRDGIEHLIPNEELITTRVENWSHTHSLVRLRKNVGVHYKSDVRLAMSLCLEALAETPRILSEPAPVCLLREFADSSVNIEMRFWINDPMNGRAGVISALLLIVWDKFHQHGIEIPYPQRDLHLKPSQVSTLVEDEVMPDQNDEN